MSWRSGSDQCGSVDGGDDDVGSDLSTAHTRRVSLSATLYLSELVNTSKLLIDGTKVSVDMSTRQAVDDITCSCHNSNLSFLKWTTPRDDLAWKGLSRGHTVACQIEFALDVTES